MKTTTALSLAAALAAIFAGTPARAGEASAEVAGPVKFELSASDGEVTVTTGRPGRIVVSGGVDLIGTEAQLVLEELPGADKPRWTVRQDGAARLPAGNLRLVLPPGSDVAVDLVSGRANLRQLAAVEVATVSARVHLSEVGQISVSTVSGDVHGRGIRGPATVKTATGDIDLASAASSSAASLVFKSSSGNLQWAGACGRDCRLDIASVSGDIGLRLDRASSFVLEFRAATGRMDDGLGLGPTNVDPLLQQGARTTGTFAGGQGQIRVRTQSGSLSLRPLR
jgi:hypothetical protein